MARTSARAKPVDLKKARFNMKGVFNEAPTVREEAAAVRAEMAYDRNPTALNEQAEKIAHNRAVVAGLERAQQKEPVAKYSEDWMRAREARLQIQMAEGRQNDILAGKLADDVSGGIQETQDMTDQMGTAVVDRTPNMTQNTQFPEITDET